MGAIRHLKEKSGPTRHRLQLFLGQNFSLLVRNGWETSGKRGFPDESEGYLWTDEDICRNVVIHRAPSRMEEVQRIKSNKSPHIADPAL